MATAEQRLAELGLELPPPPGAVAAYEPWVRVGNLVFTSGQLPWRDGKTLLFKGQIGRDLTVEQGYAACQLATLNAIAQLKAACGGDLERVRRVVRLEGTLAPALTLTGLNGPIELAFDSSGNLYVSNELGTTVSKFGVASLATVTSPTLAPEATLTGLNGPFFLQFDSSGNLYVGNYGSGNGTTVTRFAAAGLAALSSGSLAPAATLTGLNVPQAMAFDGSGNLYVANFGNGSGTTVSKFSAASLASGPLTPTATLYGLSGPINLTFDSSGNLYVSNWSANTVSEFAAAGLATLTSQSLAPTYTLTGLNGPRALAFGPSGKLYVNNYYANTVSVFAPPTQQYTAVGTYSDGSTQNITAQVSWSVTPSGVATISSTGLATAQNPISANEPTAYYPLADTAGTTAADASGNNQNGTYQGGYTLNQPGPATGVPAVALNGSTGYVSVPATPFNYPTSGSTSNYTLTVEGWFNTTSTAGGVILGQTNGGTPGGAAATGYVPAIMLGANGKIYASVFYHGAFYQIVSPGTYNNGAWHQVVDVYSNGTETLYIDGAAVGSQSVSEYGYSSTYNYYLGTGYSVGWTGGNYSGWDFFNGKLAQFAVFGTALSAAQINALYNGTLTVGAATVEAQLGGIAGFAALTAAAVANPLEGPAAGSDSDVISVAGPWTATSNSSWLHTSSSGTGDGVLTFSFDANTGATRTGTITVGPLAIPVTQAGSNYVGVNPLLTPVSAGLKGPTAVAVDSQDNAYIADTGDNAIKEWNAQTGKVTTLVSSGLKNPTGVAVDGAGNVYIADSGDSAIKEWNAQTGKVTTLVSSGLTDPTAVAVDGAGNVYIADSGDNAIKEWNAATRTVTTLVATGLADPSGVAVDYDHNVYIADTGDQAVKEWNATTGQVTPLVSSGLAVPVGVAVDGGGNVFIADAQGQVIDEWSYLTQQVTPVVSGLAVPKGVAVDVADNVYLTDASTNTLQVLVSALVPANPIIVGSAAGKGALAPVLPTTQVLTGLFAPWSDQSWLKIGTAANGVISFSFTAKPTGAARTAHITVLGQLITVTQETTQTITFAPPTAVSFGALPITLHASASSGLPITYSVISGPGTISGNQLTVTGAGNIVIEADQAGNATFAPAAPVQRTLVVYKANQTIPFATHAAVTYVTYGVSPITLGATASSGLPIAYSILFGPGSINGDQLTITGAGVIVIQANQAGNGNYNAAATVWRILLVNKAALIVAAADTTWTAGQSGQSLAGFTITGFVNDDTEAALFGTEAAVVSCPTVNARHPQAGSYVINITQGKLVTPANYTLTFRKGTLTVH